MVSQSLRPLLMLVCSIAVIPAWGGSPLDGVRARHILVSRTLLPLDVPAPGVYVPVGFSLLDELIAAAIVENRAKAQREAWRAGIADLSGDSKVAAWMNQFQLDLGSALHDRFGAPDSVIETFADHGPRQRREIALAPEPVLSALVFNEIRPQRHCGALGFALNYGSAYMKQTKDIKRRPIEVYVPKPELTQVIVSEWCLPGSETSYRTYTVGDQRIDSADALIAVLDQRKQELLDALMTPPTGDMDANRVPTITPRDHPFYVVAYGKQRSWIASTDHRMLRLVPNSNLEEIRCNSACGPIKRAQADERARRAQWERENGPLQFD